MLKKLQIFSSDKVSQAKKTEIFVNLIFPQKIKIQLKKFIQCTFLKKNYNLPKRKYSIAKTPTYLYNKPLENLWKKCKYFASQPTLVDEN